MSTRNMRFLSKEWRRRLAEQLGVIFRNLRTLHERNKTNSPGCCGTGSNWSDYTETMVGHQTIDQIS
jgi:hypothetical protein